MSAITQRVKARQEVKEDAKVLRKAIIALRDGFEPHLSPVDFLRKHMVSPQFGNNVNLANYKDADVEARCKCGKHFGSHLEKCPCGESAEHALYVKR